MKQITTLVISTLILSACATGRDYSTRAELRADPGTTEAVEFSAPIRTVYPKLKDMVSACFDSRYMRTAGESPGADGHGANITITTIPSLIKSRIIATISVEPKDAGTVATIYFAGEKPPAGLVSMFRRWIDGGQTTCAATN